MLPFSVTIPATVPQRLKTRRVLWITLYYLDGISCLSFQSTFVVLASKLSQKHRNFSPKLSLAIKSIVMVKRWILKNTSCFIFDLTVWSSCTWYLKIQSLHYKEPCVPITKTNQLVPFREMSVHSAKTTVPSVRESTYSNSSAWQG